MPERSDITDYMRSRNFARSLQTFYFEAMSAGYAGDEVTKYPLPEFPGSKAIDWSIDCNGQWKVLDTYVVSPFSDHSAGTTFIWFDGQPVWMMQYMGSYPKEALPCLRAALRSNYRQRIFLGGRGPEHFTHGGFTYTNNVRESNFYGDSFGHEIIFDNNSPLIGWHSYQSTYLIEELRQPRAS